ncbi:hypothetical protein MF271_21925 (plasmid) [Deinococcus sp. KNUC1210]|uniref:hypothetical protein n=1 Tax=Deinococcus sp. KNUC1210 TaxID=2917691 RepID=UPI001EEFD802|nr:hypothetical protein [Deinococcus sp. KNUC1210]ULH18138.1 hypothetical protein MF271_21925 [Deinococcus sp. KNUC1210]
MTDPSDLTPTELVEVLRNVNADGQDVSGVELTPTTRHELAEALNSDDKFQTALTDVLETWVTKEEL